MTTWRSFLIEIRISALCLLTASLLVVSWVPVRCARGQDAADDFGDDAPVEAEAADEAETAVASPPKKAEPEPAKDSDSKKIDLTLEDPAVRSVLLANPQTPAELVQAIDILMDLDRAELARPLLDRIIQAKLDAPALAALAKKFGSGVFIKLARNEALAPAGAELADAVLAAAGAERENPAQLEKLVRQLSDANPLVRQEAIVELGQVHEAAITPLVRVLADPKRASEHVAVRKMLMHLDREAIGPLTAVLGASDPVLVVEATNLLGSLRATEALPRLLAPAIAAKDKAVRAAAQQAVLKLAGHQPTLVETREVLTYRIHAALDLARKSRADGSIATATWQWDAAKGHSTLVELPAADLAAAQAAILARDLAMLPPEGESQGLVLLAELTEAKFAAGFDHPLPTGAGTIRSQLATHGTPALESALATALKQQNILAATAAAEILGDIGSANSLVGKGGGLAPLVEATRSPDRRLRFAALDAILRIGPRSSFSGAGLIADHLAFFAGTTGLRKALVGHPNGHVAQQLAAMLAGLGYEADQVTNSRQLMELASQSPDYEFALVHVALGNPGVDDLLGRLRRDPRTADLPVGLMAEPETHERAERLARAVPLVTMISQVTNEQALEFQLVQVFALTGRDQVSFDQRQRQASTALDWLGQLSESRPTWSDFQHVASSVERALYAPGQAVRAALILSNLPSASAQRSLVELASRAAFPIEVRRAAAVAFRRSVRRYHLLLTSDQTLSQYEIYNNSSRQPRETQAVLASILDTIEGKEAGDAPTQP